MASTTQIGRDQTVPLATAPGQRLRSDAAAAWDAAARACQAQLGWTPTLTDSFRPYDVQERIFRQRYRQGNHKGQAGYTADVRNWNGQPWTRLAGQAAAAIPGTSNHGGGVAVDAGRGGQSFGSFTDPQRAAFLAIAARYGWDDSEGRSVGEPWHLGYNPAHDQHPAPTPPPAPEPQKRDEDMICIRNTANGAVIFVSGGVGARVTSTANYAALKAAGVPEANVDADQFALFQKRFGA